MISVSDLIFVLLVYVVYILYNYASKDVDVLIRDIHPIKESELELANIKEELALLRRDVDKLLE